MKKTNNNPNFQDTKRSNEYDLFFIQNFMLTEKGFLGNAVRPQMLRKKHVNFQKQIAS